FPGHTGGSICLLVDNALFTGDTLFVGYCGRTDSAGASSEKLYHSLFDKIAKLPVEIKVYPGHNYGKRPVSTVGYERLHNPYYQCKNREEFVELRRKGV
ncbi:MBL fold metallo-hydrolase, partial [Candidatus Aerophobetes bacterium]|nr:MBL fold metallo-hydrolase [Candidatus Aerophobetes bacterium]